MPFPPLLSDQRRTALVGSFGSKSSELEGGSADDISAMGMAAFSASKMARSTPFFVATARVSSMNSLLALANAGSSGSLRAASQSIPAEYRLIPTQSRTNSLSLQFGASRRFLRLALRLNSGSMMTWRRRRRGRTGQIFQTSFFLNCRLYRSISTLVKSFSTDHVSARAKLTKCIFLRRIRISARCKSSSFLHFSKARSESLRTAYHSFGGRTYLA